MKYFWLALIGLIFGFSLSRIGFSSWDEVHHMFLFTDLRLTLAFACAVALMAMSWLVITRFSKPRWSPRQIHKGTLIGGLLFGLGWSISGACPSIALVQLGEGQLGAMATLTGIFLGNWLYAVVHQRYFRWTTLSCVDQ